MQYQSLHQGAFFWALQGLCALHRKPFSIDLAQQQLAAPYTIDALSRAAPAFGFDATLRKAKPEKLHKESFPLIAWLTLKTSAEPAVPEDEANADAAAAEVHADAVEDVQTVPALILQADAANVLLLEPDDAAPRTIALAEFGIRYQGYITRITPQADPATDPDSEAQARQSRKFGFRWFVPELLKHKHLWRDVLIASLVIQLLALGTPLFTQVIIDKVVVHHTESTLIVIGIGLAVFMVFSATVLGAPVPGPAYRQPCRCGPGRLRVRPPVQAAAALLRAPSDRRDRRPPARRRNHPRIHRQRRRHADPRLALPADLRRHHVLLQRHPDPDRAGNAERHRDPEPDRRPDVPGPSQRAIPARRAQPGFRHRICGWPGNGQVPANGAAAQRRYSDLSGQYLSAGFAIRQIGNTYNTLPTRWNR